MVTASGGVRCWGDNTRGQLGSPAAGSFSAIPVDVAGLTSGVTSIAAGAAHTCAVLSTSAVKCWGANDQGQLGDGSMVDRSTPVSVLGFDSGGGFGLITGAAFTCVSLGAFSNGFPAPGGSYGLKCFGAYGNPGAPTAVPQFMVTCGDVHLCVLPLSGALVQTGSIGADASHACISVSGTTTLTMGTHTFCWGEGSSGQLGDGSYNSSLSGLARTNVSQRTLAAGQKHTCAVLGPPFQSPGVQCWGDNAEGQLGVGAGTARTNTPVDLPAFSGGGDPQSIAAGRLFSCVSISGSGAVRCWGDNARGQLGDGTTMRRYTPVPVAGLSGVQEIAAGSNHACARLAGDVVVCWGANERGQLGDASTTDQPAPALVTSGQPVAPMVTSSASSLTVAAGEAVIWTASALGTPVPRLQWQYSVDGGITWYDIGDATTPVLSFTPAVGDSGRQFHTVFVNSSGSVTTAAATLTVTGDRTMTADIDGDGLSDLVVWRPSSGTWFWLTSSSSFDQAAAGRLQFGNAALGDVPLTGDIDGDGRDDLIVWRASTGRWYWLTSSTGYSYAAAGGLQWGNAALGDIPIVADLDGDGRADLVVWRASTGTWYWLLSSNGYRYDGSGSVQWGNQSLGDRPIVGDIDGDGRGDLAVWRASTGTWYWLTSSTGYAYQSAGAVQWGSAGYFDAPFLRDVDGDGRADLIVWRPGSGRWYWLTSSSGYSYAALGQLQFGAQGDTPLALEVDRDGRFDPAVWRPGTGTWFWLQSTANYDYGLVGVHQWGSAAGSSAR